MRSGYFDSIRVAREENLDRSRHSLHSANGRIRLYLLLRKLTGCTSARAAVEPPFSLRSIQVGKQTLKTDYRSWGDSDHMLARSINHVCGPVVGVF